MKVYAIKDLFGILVIVNANVIKIVIFGEYLDHENCKFRKKLADKLIDECAETTDETKLVNITFTENENNYECGCCIVYIVLMKVVFTIFTGITVHLVYCNWYLIKSNIYCIKFNTRTIGECNYIKWEQQNK